MKDVRHRKEHTVKFHLYKVLKQGKLICDDNRSIVHLCGMGHHETSWHDDNVLCFDRGVSYKAVCIFQSWLDST